MKNIFLLLLVCCSIRGIAQTTPNIDKALAQGVRLTRVPEDYKPLVMVDGEPYEGKLSNFRASSLESVTILDSITAHAAWNGPGIHGAISIETKQHKIIVCKNKLAELGNGFRNFVREYKGSDKIIYRLNGHMLKGDNYSIANTLYKIPVNNIKWVLTLVDTTASGDPEAIVSVRTKK
jgi:hypothetical protein